MPKQIAGPPTSRLEWAINSSVKLRIARLLTSLPDKGFTGRELARLLGVSHSSVQEAMRAFVAGGLAVRTTVGRAHLFRTNQESYLFKALRSLFRREREMRDDMLDELRTALGKGAVSVVLFGSYARGTEDPKSDFDAIVVSTDVASTEESVQNLGARFLRRYGVRLSAKVLAPEELRQKRNAPYIRSAREEGIVIAGKTLLEAMKGGG
jgi:predicted nucleotidyltransferase/biotin operon repressor